MSVRTTTLLALAALSLVAIAPAALATTAVCDSTETNCVGAGASSEGDCDDSGHSFVGAYTYGEALSSGVNVVCYATVGDWTYEYSAVNANFASCTASCALVGFQWSAFSGDIEDCGTNVYTDNAVTGWRLVALGCPVGAPPAIVVPTLL